MTPSRTPPGTPLPWKLWNGWGPLKADGLMRVLRIGSPTEGLTTGWRCGDIVGSREDFEYLIEACNAYPGLVSENARLREALTKYGWHTTRCEASLRPGADCDCGLSALLAERGETR